MNRPGWLIFSFLVLADLNSSINISETPTETNLAGHSVPNLYDQVKMNKFSNTTQFNVEELEEQEGKNIDGSGEIEESDVTDESDENIESGEEEDFLETYLEEAMEVLKDEFASQGYLVDGDYPDDWDFSKPSGWLQPAVLEKVSSGYINSEESSVMLAVNYLSELFE